MKGGLFPEFDQRLVAYVELLNSRWMKQLLEQISEFFGKSSVEHLDSGDLERVPTLTLAIAYAHLCTACEMVLLPHLKLEEHREGDPRSKSLEVYKAKQAVHHMVETLFEEEVAKIIHNSMKEEGGRNHESIKRQKSC